VKFRTFSKEILDTLAKYMEELHQENIASNPFYAKVYNDWTPFKEDIHAFHKINEFAFLEYVTNN